MFNLTKRIMKSLNFEDVNVKVSKIIDDLTNKKRTDVDVARLKEANNAMKTLILNNSKKLVYNQFMKKAERVSYFENN